MATEKEEIILDFKVDSGDLLKEATASKKAILDVKDAQRDLNKEFAKGTISVEEYAAESVQLEQKLKKEQATYGTLTKAINVNSNSLDAQRQKLAALTKERNAVDRSSIEGVKRFDSLTASIKKLNTEIGKAEQKGGDFRRNVGNYTESIKDAAGQINIAGTNVGALGAQLESFASPATAAIGIATALGAAYAASSTGARDLGFAQAKLSAGTSILLEDFGKLVGGPDGGGGKGPASQLLDVYLGLVKAQINLATYGLLSDYLNDVGDQADKAAKALERMKDLQISLAFAQGFSKEDERKAELQRRLRDDETKSIQERLAAAEKIDPILENSSKRTVVILQAQIAAIKESTANYENNRSAQLQVAQLTSEIKDKEEEITGKLTENVAARQKLGELLRQQLADEELVRRQGGRNEQVSVVSGASSEDFSTRAQVDLELESFEVIMRGRKKLTKDTIKLKEEEAAAIKKYEEQKLAVISQSLGAAASLFEQDTAAYKVLASIDAGVNTYKAANLALATFPPPLSYIAMAATIAAGLGNVARINGIGFAEGGYTGPGGKYDPAGIVHRNEVVWNQTDVALSGGPQAVDRMRPTYHPSLRGYADGGIVTAPAQETNNAILTANAFRNAPASVLSVVEFNRVASRVRVKQNASKITNRSRK